MLIEAPPRLAVIADQRVTRLEPLWRELAPGSILQCNQDEGLSQAAADRLIRYFSWHEKRNPGARGERDNSGDEAVNKEEFRAFLLMVVELSAGMRIIRRKSINDSF
jgi:hypothetical protein